MKNKKFRIIEQLREKFPNDVWYYSPRARTWVNVTGKWHVVRKAHLSPWYDGDDDSFSTRYYRSDTNKEIGIVGDWIWIG